MGHAVLGLLGLALGVAGAQPAALLARRARRGIRVSVGAGLFATLTSLMLLTVALGMGYMAMGASVLILALAMLAGFLGAWAVEAWRAWHWMRPWS